jgi:TonB family protein
MILLLPMLLVAQEAPAIQPAPAPSPPPAGSVRDLRPPPPNISVPLRPRNPGGWVTNDDYPPEAVQGRMQGTVRFLLNIDATGAVTGCRVTGTSGWPLLDETTCVLLRERARFDPARDAKNKPIASIYSNKFRWEMPEPVRVAAVSWSMSARLVVQANGNVTSCTLTNSAAVPPDVASACDDFKSRPLWSRFPMLGDMEGRPGIVTVETSLTIEGAENGVKEVDPAAPDLLSLVSTRFEISESGAIENCRQIATAPGMTQQSSTPSCDIGYGPFKPVLGRDGKPRRVAAAYIIAMSVKTLPASDPDWPSV